MADLETTTTSIAQSPSVEIMIFEIGEIRHGHDVGYKSKGKVRWQSCPDCGKERWVEMSKVKASRCCRTCSAKRGTLAIKERGILAGNRFNWQGGRHKTPSGYILVWISNDSPFYSMASKDGYVPEHRLIMAQHLGRPLLRQEQVHHKNGVREDNHIENLELLSRTNHSLYTKFCAHCSMRKEIRLLSWQIKEQSEQIMVLTSKLMGIGQ